jgi:hypothetical protein
MLPRLLEEFKRKEQLRKDISSKNPAIFGTSRMPHGS